MKKRTRINQDRKGASTPTVGRSDKGSSIVGQRRAKSGQFMKGCRKTAYKRSPIYESMARMEVRVEYLIDKVNRHCSRHWCVESGIVLIVVGVIVDKLWPNLFK